VFAQDLLHVVVFDTLGIARCFFSEEPVSHFLSVGCFAVWIFILVYFYFSFFFPCYSSLFFWSVFSDVKLAAIVYSFPVVFEFYLPSSLSPQRPSPKCSAFSFYPQ